MAKRWTRAEAELIWGYTGYECGLTPKEKTQFARKLLDKPNLPYRALHNEPIMLQMRKKLNKRWLARCYKPKEATK